MYRFLFYLATLSYLPLAGADNGLIMAKNPYTMDEPVDHFVQTVTGKGMIKFTRIGHAESIAIVGRKLPSMTYSWKRSARR